MKVALVHDYLREYGGAERVVEVLHELYPEAPLYTSFVDWRALGEHAHRFKKWDIRTSWVQKNWVMRRFHSALRFLTPLVWESLDLREFNVIISSSGWFMCRGVVTRPEQVHISYIHHPPRNLYGYPTGSPPNGLIKFYGAVVNPFLRMYDFATAQRVDYLIANSKETQARIKKFYRRESTVIYPPASLREALRAGPPIEAARITYQVSSKKSNYYLSVGRLTYAKRVDLAIKAANELKLPLKIVGIGKEEKYLRSIAGSTIEFTGAVSDAQLNVLFNDAMALIFCALQEDFGIVPVEAMAHGTPVVALKQGGVVETVVDGKTGVFFNVATVSSLVTAIQKFTTLNYAELSRQSVKQAAKFSKAVFLRNMKDFVETAWNNSSKVPVEKIFPRISSR
ncbi:TPA: glycosyltransferase family 4 protein [Patescibacteria group bacterium]|uniref:Glycosyltransferase n=1 Tax=Candidatus Gottesmanbacteria bacterium GW2011_GWA1_43_11 TaxID=1618436 RepID=A0A0G1CK39_9BACT|nr:MAG: glycosyltransferase [Candidatus Gottesmanbacteria bacterium GW2011_GWA1_43_11]HCS78795.1 glycosyltransferase family 4 protein [Patescibacteria group bacterium]